MKSYELATSSWKRYSKRQSLRAQSSILEIVDEDYESPAPDDMNFKEVVTAFVDGHKIMMKMMRNTRKRKIYIDKSDKFDDKIR